MTQNQLKNGKLFSLLYRSFDTPLSPSDQKRLELGLIESEQLREEKQQIETQREMISRCAGEMKYHPFFAGKVMERIRSISRQETGQEIFFNSLFVFFKRVAIAGVLLCMIFLAYALLTDDSNNAINELSMSPESYEAMLQIP